jgi:energy-converting hydrogenase Eha subunit C
LWNYRDPEFALEIALLAGGIGLYLARNPMPSIRKGAVIAFGIVLVIVQIGDTYVPRAPLTDKATVIGVWVFYALFVLIAFGVEKIGNRKKLLCCDNHYFRCFGRRQNDGRQVAGART